MSNNIFLEEFNILFNKIPHIYSEIFLKIFKNNYYFFLDYNKNNNLNLFTKVLDTSFHNLSKLNNKNYYYNYILKYLSNNNIDYNLNTVNNISNILSSSIEVDYILDIIDNNYHIKPIHNNVPNYLTKLYIYFLISKTLIKISIILAYYNNIKDIKFKNYINITVEKYRTLELDMDHVLDDYNSHYNHLISKTNYKILIYILCLSKNAQDIETKYHNTISKIIASLGYDTKMHRITNYYRINNNIKPYIYTNITKLLNILFYKYHDNYSFISNKDKILKTCFYIYIKELSLKDKIIISITYPLWEYEWNSIKEIYNNY